MAATALFPAALTLVVGTGTAGASGNYVALGDSYTSGPDIPTQSTSPAGCLRSNHNYPSATATALGLSLTDVSCSGATTADMTSSQAVTPGPANPPQLNAVTSSTQVVSIQVGGDDLGFTSIIENCAALTPWGPTKVGLNCKNYYDPHGNDSLQAAVNALEPRVVSVIADVQTKAPLARIFVVGYPAILPQNGACWPSMPFETGDAEYLNQTEVELNSALATAAASKGAIYVNTYTPSINHNACTAEATRWVEPLVPASPAYPVHPNANGEAAMAQALEAAMNG
jgi:lysophospholipase L1-like esterase